MPGTAHTWVDGDVATAARLNALPRGIMGYAVRTTDQSGVSATADITSLSVTFTAISSRYYKTTLGVRYQPTTSSNIDIFITDGSNNIKQDWADTRGTSEYGAMSVTVVETGLSGSTTRKGRASSSAGTITLFGNAVYPTFILVEDIGP